MLLEALLAECVMDVQGLFWMSGAGSQWVSPSLADRCARCPRRIVAGKQPGRSNCAGTAQIYHEALLRFFGVTQKSTKLDLLATGSEWCGPL